MNMFEDILFEQTDGIAVLTVNRPHAMNAMRAGTKEEIGKALSIVEETEEIKALLITGTGRAFISGSDISEIGIDAPGEETAKMSAHIHELFNRLEKLPKPTMAVINGYALGGGLELALACDLRVSTPEAKMGMPEIELGVLPCYGGTQRLPRVVGAGLAKEMLFTGRMLNGEEALRVGLVNRCFPAETLMEDSSRWMREIVAHSGPALRYAKECVDRGMEMSMEEGLALESRVAGLLVETPEAKKNVTAFIEERRRRKQEKAARANSENRRDG